MFGAECIPMLLGLPVVCIVAHRLFVCAHPVLACSNLSTYHLLYLVGLSHFKLPSLLSSCANGMAWLNANARSQDTPYCCIHIYDT